jgi:hypothetical protein
MQNNQNDIEEHKQGRYIKYVKDNELKLILNYNNNVLDGEYEIYHNEKMVVHAIFENGDVKILDLYRISSDLMLHVCSVETELYKFIFGTLPD